MGLQRNSFYTTSQKSNLQLIQQETCRHPQGFMLLLPSAEKKPVPKTRTARDSRATSRLAGCYPRTSPEPPADTPRCAAGGGKAPPRLSSPALAARSCHGPGADQRLAAGAVLFPRTGFLFCFFHPIALSGGSGVYLPVNPHGMASLRSRFQKLLEPLSAASRLAGWRLLAAL